VIPSSVNPSTFLVGSPLSWQDIKPIFNVNALKGCGTAISAAFFAKIEFPALRL
jgi:hypothetical protein